MTATVAIVFIDQNYSAALRRALDLLGGTADLNLANREVTIKIGLFDPKQHHHTCVEGVQAIVDAFDQAPRVYLAESDNYCGPALERLERFRPVFSERVVPASLSDPTQAELRAIAGGEMALGSVMFKPRVFVSTHVLRTFIRGSILKNLFGCTPMVKKSAFHKNTIFCAQLADIFEAVGGIDLAVLDGTNLFFNASDKLLPMNILAVSRDAVALEVVGMLLAGVKPEKSPVIQEFVRRGLGEGDINNIQIVGVSAAEFTQLKRRHKELKKMIAAAPKLPGVSDTIDILVEAGWFGAARCVPEVVVELQQRGVTNATPALVETTLKRRAGKTLERAKEGEGRSAPWLYKALRG